MQIRPLATRCRWLQCFSLVIGLLYGPRIVDRSFLGFGIFGSLLAVLPKSCFVIIHSKGTTMHEYLASSFHAGRRLQLLAAIATIIGLGAR